MSSLSPFLSKSNRTVKLVIIQLNSLVKAKNSSIVVLLIKQSLPLFHSEGRIFSFLGDVTSH